MKPICFVRFGRPTGNTMQDARLSDLILPGERLIANISSSRPLAACDVKAAMDGLGRPVNTVAAEPAV